MKQSVKISRDALGMITVAFSYDHAYVSKIRSIPGRRWHPEEKYWTVPDSEEVIKKILSIFDREFIQIDPPFISIL